MNNSILEIIESIREGFSEGTYNNKKYGITKSTFNQGNSFKLYAKELGGSDFISLNYYKTTKKEFLKPCEMPEAKVIHFLKNIELKKG